MRFCFTNNLCAVVAHSKAETSPECARGCGTASMVLSIIGIVLGVIFVIIILVTWTMGLLAATHVATQVSSSLVRLNIIITTFRHETLQ